jgi:hypothetical protein
MSALRFETVVPNVPDYRADALTDEAIFEVKVEPRDARSLRTAVMELARVAAADPKRRLVLVLAEPAITDNRLRAEWRDASEIIRPELFRRMSMAIHEEGEWRGIPKIPTAAEIATLEKILRHERARKRPISNRTSEAYYEILRILVHQWLLARGRVSIGSLVEISGASHPTISKSLQRLEHYLIRHSDRSVELRIFPRDEWSKLLAVSETVRQTAGFIDRSGQPRSAESLLRRLRELPLRALENSGLRHQDIGVGGIQGARHYQRSFDLVGLPRLDLSLHSPDKALDLSFVKRLDPGLEKARPNESPSLVIHLIRRANSLFEASEDDLLWADPAECLLDLQEARLDAQALEFFHSFPRAKGQSL